MNKFLGLIVGLFCVPVFAATLSQTQDAAFALNRAQPGSMQKYQLGTMVTAGTVMVAKANFDVASQGGTQGAYVLRGDNGQPVILPNKAVIVDCIIDVQTQGATSASGTIAIGTGQSTSDLKGATAAASYTGRLACVPVGTAATSIKLTADSTMSATIATGTVTQGKFTVLVQYILSN